MSAPSGASNCISPQSPRLPYRQARDFLRDTAEAIRKRYLAAGADKVRFTKVVVEEWVRDSPRHFAACQTDGSKIVLSSELARMDPRIVGAIIGHEFGHAVDFSYPACFLLQRDGTLDVRRAGTRSNDAIPRERTMYWEKRSSDQIERTADLIAEKILGVRIGYCTPCKLQTLLVGAPDEVYCDYPRPRGLR